MSLVRLVIEWAEARAEWAVGNKTSKLGTPGFDMLRFKKAQTVLLKRAEELGAILPDIGERKYF